MDVGQAVVLLNASPVASSFYDVFNRRYVVAPKPISLLSLPYLLCALPRWVALPGYLSRLHLLRRFQTVTGEGGTARYFANLAIGSLTRPCHVDAQFKVFVIYPWSQIAESPPAFLDRFCKFELSLADILRKRHERTIFARDPDSEAAHSLLSILNEGALQFVKAVGSECFFGLAGEETVASVVLNLLGSDVGEVPAEAGSGLVQLRVPLLPSPFHPPKSVPGGPGSGGGAPVEWLDLPGVPTAHLAEYVRQANFHLLQLMRPESVYLHRAALPPEYLREYIERQEHFSLARFVTSLVHAYLCEPARSAAVSAVTGEVATANATATSDVVHGPAVGADSGSRGAATVAVLQKWVVFTRSSGELKRLYTDWGLLAPLLAPLRAQSPEGLDSSTEAFVRHWAAAYNLDRFETEAQCNEAVQTFAAHPTQRALFVLADMGAVQASQVNHVRFQVEEHVVPRVDDGRPRVVVVHVPPEQVMKLPAAYQAVFLRDWQFLWVDGLGAFAAPPQPPLPQQRSPQQAGTAAAAAGAGAVPALSAAPSAVMELDDAMDARHWVAVAFGLEQAAPLAAGGERGTREAGGAGGDMVALFEESLLRCVEQHISDPTELPIAPTFMRFRDLYGPRSAPAKVALLGPCSGRVARCRAFGTSCCTSSRGRGRARRWGTLCGRSRRAWSEPSRRARSSTRSGASCASAWRPS